MRVWGNTQVWVMPRKRGSGARGRTRKGSLDGRRRSGRRSRRRERAGGTRARRSLPWRALGVGRPVGPEVAVPVRGRELAGGPATGRTLRRGGSTRRLGAGGGRRRRHGRRRRRGASGNALALALCVGLRSAKPTHAGEIGWRAVMDEPALGAAGTGAAREPLMAVSGQAAAALGCRARGWGHPSSKCPLHL